MAVRSHTQELHVSAPTCYDARMSYICLLGQHLGPHHAPSRLRGGSSIFYASCTLLALSTASLGTNPSVHFPKLRSVAGARIRPLALNKRANFHRAHVKVFELVCVSAVCHPHIVGRLMLPTSLHQFLEGKFDERLAQLLVRLVLNSVCS